MPGFLAEVLTWPSSYSYTLAVQTAMSLNLPPTVFMLPNKQPTDGWSMADKKLAMAWTVLQRETCKICGEPVWICRSSEKNLLFKVRKDTCYSKAALERWQKGKGSDNLKPGEYTYVVAEMRGDAPKPNRQAYLKELSEE